MSTHTTFQLGYTSYQFEVHTVGHMDPQQGDVIGRVENSFFDTQATGTSTGIGIGTANRAYGRTTEQMKSQATLTNKVRRADVHQIPFQAGS